MRRTQLEGTFAIIAALIVLFTSLWDPLISVVVSIVALLSFGIFSYLRK